MSKQIVTTIPKLVSQYGQRLEAAGIEAGRVEIEIILEKLLQLDRLDLYLHGAARVTDDILTQLSTIVARRETRYPLQYILGSAWFYGREFLVSEAVMIPTPETELLCDTAKQFASARGLTAPRILDLGTGSGVIAVTLACELPGAKIVAVDLSPEALGVAQENGRRLAPEKIIDWRASDLFAAISDDEQFDLILSNPPYISEDEYRDLPAEVLADPKLALTAGAEGMDIITRLLQEAPRFLHPRGRLKFEIGYNQGQLVADHSVRDSRYTSFALLQDLNGIDRVVMLGCEPPVS